MTPFGKAMRKIRIDRGMKLFDQAALMGFSSAYLSNVETGKKAIPADLLDRITTAMNLKQQEIEELRSAINHSRKAVALDLGGRSNEAKEVAMAFARKFDSLDQSQLDEIFAVLRKSNK